MDLTKRVVKYGYEEETSLFFGSRTIGSVYSINEHECMVSTNKDICRFEKNEIKESNKYQFAASTTVPGTDFIIGVTARKGEFIVARINDMIHPLFEGLRTFHEGIFHIIYSPESNVIITIGTGVKVWNMFYTKTDKNVSVIRPEVRIWARTSFADDYSTVILSCPAFDYERELLFLPTEYGIRPYTIDGVELSPVTKVAADFSTSYAYNNFTMEMITYDNTYGLRLWDKLGKMIKQFSSSNSSILALIFLDEEHVFCLNSKHMFFIINTKTGRSCHLGGLGRHPTRIAFIKNRKEPEISIATGNTIKIIRLMIPWITWALNVQNAKQIIRCNKLDEPGRILVQTNNSFIKLYSPKNGKLITDATPSQSVHPISYFYERGLKTLRHYDRKNNCYREVFIKTADIDELFILLEDGTTVGFNTGITPCEEVMQQNMKSAYMILVDFKEETCYAFASELGDLFIVDYSTFKVKYRFAVANERIYGLYSIFENQTILFIFKDSIALFDLKSGQILDTIEIGGSHVHSVYGDILKIGYPSGHIAHVNIGKNTLTSPDLDFMQRPHLNAITSFSFSTHFWCSSSLDCQVLVWDYNCFNLVQIILPIPIVATCIMNGKRDILVATETEIMKINHEWIFPYEKDTEDIHIDNYDRVLDSLVSQTVKPEEEVQEEAHEDFLSSFVHHDDDIEGESYDSDNIGSRSKPSRFKFRELLNKRNKTQDNKSIIATHDGTASQEEKERVIAEMMKLNEAEEEHKRMMGQGRIISRNGENDDNDNNNGDDDDDDNNANDSSNGGKGGGGSHKKNKQGNNSDKNGKTSKDGKSGGGNNGDDSKKKSRRQKVATQGQSATDFLKQASIEEEEEKKRKKRRSKRKQPSMKESQGDETEQITTSTKDVVNLMNSMFSKTTPESSQLLSQVLPKEEIDVSKLFNQMKSKETDDNNENNNIKSTKLHKHRSEKYDNSNNNNNEESFRDEGGNRTRYPRKYSDANVEIIDQEEFSETTRPRRTRRMSLREQALIPNNKNTSEDFSTEKQQFKQSSPFPLKPKKGSAIERLLTGKRAPTPSPIRWNYVAVNKLNYKRAKTPTLRTKVKRKFVMPAPNIVLDAQAILSEFGKGCHELFPLIRRLSHDHQIGDDTYYHVEKQVIEMKQQNPMSVTTPMAPRPPPIPKKCFNLPVRSLNASHAIVPRAPVIRRLRNCSTKDFPTKAYYELRMRGRSPSFSNNADGIELQRFDLPNLAMNRNTQSEACETIKIKYDEESSTEGQFSEELNSEYLRREVQSKNSVNNSYSPPVSDEQNNENKEESNYIKYSGKSSSQKTKITPIVPIIPATNYPVHPPSPVEKPIETISLPIQIPPSKFVPIMVPMKPASRKSSSAKNDDELANLLLLKIPTFNLNTTSQAHAKTSRKITKVKVYNGAVRPPSLRKGPNMQTGTLAIVTHSRPTTARRNYP